MTELPTTEARSIFGDVVNRAAFGKERLVLTKHGKRLAALVPIEDLELLEGLENRRDAEAVREAYAEQGDAPAEPWPAVKARLGLVGAKAAPRKRAPRRRRK
ncbi:MAG: type II toxin-antitoxin system Phd/YefM family antitoxin [Myxococcales bacterium]|nr:type II toxin-antitoxin system Phd/YefM family antitoxin [Myxococcales bacterium]